MNKDEVMSMIDTGLNVKATKTLFEIIYSKWSTRTCGNCMYAKITGNWNDEGIEVIDCSKLHKSFEDVGNFGCNKFERMD